MLMPKVLQSKLPRLFGEPEEDVATGESIWGMITKSEEGSELESRPLILEEPVPEPSAETAGPTDRLMANLGQNAPAEKLNASSDRLLSSMNQIPPATDRSLPRRAGTPFPVRPKGERPVRPPKVTIQKSILPPTTSKRVDFEAPLILDAKDKQPEIEAAPKPKPKGLAAFEPLSLEPPKLDHQAEPQSFESEDFKPLSFEPIGSEPSEMGATKTDPKDSQPNAVSEAPAVQPKPLWKSGSSSSSSASTSTPKPFDPTRRTPIAPISSKANEPSTKPAAIDWGSSPNLDVPYTPPTARPSIVFSADGRPMGPDHDLLHTPFVIRRSRRPKLGPIAVIAAGTLAFVLLNGVALYYMPKLLGERQAPLPLRGPISEPNVMASNAPAMRPLSPSEGGPAPTAVVPSPAPAPAPVVQAQPAAKALVAAAPVAAAPVKTTSAAELTKATGEIKAPPAPSLKPALAAAAPVIEAPVTPAKVKPVKEPVLAAAAATTAPKPTLSQTTAQTNPSAPAAVQGDPPTAADGVLVQIGAFATTDVADKGWRAVSTALPSEMAGKTRRVQPIAKGGSTLYRTMVAGFSDKEKAAQFCSDLKEKGLACFVRP